MRDWDKAAEYLAVTPRMVRELWARHDLSGIRVGRHIRFSQSDLDAFIEGHRRDAVR